MILGYARFVPHDPNPEVQQVALRKAGCAGCLPIAASPALARRRPQLEKALKRLRAGDELVVGKPTALAGSLGDLLDLMRQIEDSGATLRSPHSALTPASRDEQRNRQASHVGFRFRKDDAVCAPIATMDGRGIGRIATRHLNIDGHELRARVEIRVLRCAKNACSQGLQVDGL
jgi:hypothetical protein